MNQSKLPRYIVMIEEGAARGDLFGLEQVTYFHIVDTILNEVVMTLRGDMQASLSPDDGQWENYEYSGVIKVTLSEDQETALVENYDGSQEQIALPRPPANSIEKHERPLSPLPGTVEIDELLAFLPRLCEEGFEPVEDWHANDDIITFPYPLYHPDVMAFIEIASRHVWCDYNYIPSQSYHMLSDPDFIARASLAQIRTMLTYIVRGERFGDGHWAAMIEQGYLKHLLERLAEIRATENLTD